MFECMCISCTLPQQTSIMLDSIGQVPHIMLYMYSTHGVDKAQCVTIINIQMYQGTMLTIVSSYEGITIFGLQLQVEKGTRSLSCAVPY